MKDSPNPFHAPTRRSDHVSADTEILDQATQETRDNILFTSRVAKFSSVSLSILAIFSFVDWVLGFNFLLSVSYGLTWLHVMHAFRVLFPLTSLFFAWRAWLFSSSLKRITVSESPDYAKFVVHQTWIWLTIAFMIFLLWANIGLSFSASYSNSEYIWQNH